VCEKGVGVMDKKKIEKNRVMLAHGNGGTLTHELINDIFLSAFSNPILDELSDSAVVTLNDSLVVFTTDSYVVHPLFFPGGDIGTLAVSGTINDISVMGAHPYYLSAAFIIEEGFPLDDLSEITISMQKTASKAGVTVVTGDTKVVEKGKVDGLYITTAGIGIITQRKRLSSTLIQDGDVVIINGTIGDHGIAVLTAREDFPLTTKLESDCTPLNGLIDAVMNTTPDNGIRIMRDPTRGGLATTLNEFVSDTSFGIEIEESLLPVRNEVKAICEMTGYDPLYIANEGKVVVIASQEASPHIIAAMKNHPLGRESRIIGRVTGRYRGKVFLKTAIGGLRIVDMLASDMFPRIC
jgi:hydrogenase expression/formation protein HypE